MTGLEEALRALDKAFKAFEAEISKLENVDELPPYFAIPAYLLKQRQEVLNTIELAGGVNIE